MSMDDFGTEPCGDCKATPGMYVGATESYPCPTCNGTTRVRAKPVRITVIKPLEGIFRTPDAFDKFTEFFNTALGQPYIRRTQSEDRMHRLRQINETPPVQPPIPNISDIEDYD